jgi:cytochrome c oxidase subunit II
MGNATRWAVGAGAAAMAGLWAAVAASQQPHPWQLGLQDPASPIKAQLDSFHNLLLVIIIGIVLIVAALLVYVMVRFNAKANPTPTRTSHNTVLEVAWTVVPVIILVVIAVPSFRVLYYMERTPEAEMTLKVTGRQWYWDYEYPDQGGFGFSANMVADDQLKPGQPRLLETDKHIVLPVDTVIRIQVTAGDVIHSWAVPAFGIKRDAVPGRLNESWVKIEREGMYYGQCSELCGVNHGFMPIAVEAVSKEKFGAWVKQAQAEAGIAAVAAKND